MRRDGEATALVDDLANFAGGRALQIGNGGADTEQVAFLGRDLLAGDDEEIIDRLAVLAHQAFVEQVGDGVTGVVIGDGKPVQAFRAGGGDVLLRSRNAIARKEGMGMEVDIERHRWDASLRASKWEASVSRSGRWSAKRSGGVNRAFCSAKGGLRRVAPGSRFSIGSSFFSRPGSMSKWIGCERRERSCRSSGRARSSSGCLRGWSYRAS